jgi:RNA polymerase sigma-70 factor (ECF subfamily)
MSGQFGRKKQVYYFCFRDYAFFDHSFTQARISVSEKEQDLYLFKKVKKGDCKSYKILFEKYYCNLCNFAFTFINDMAQSEEVVADVFIKLWEKRIEIDIRSAVKPFLYHTTRNAAIDSIRKDIKYKRIIIIPRNDLELSPETLMIRKEILEHFNHMLDKLPKQAGLVFRLVKIDRLRYKEVAFILNISEKTVENHMGKALRLMRDMYEKDPAIFDE